MASQEEMIINFRYIRQQLKLQTFERSAVRELLATYSKARKSVALKLEAATKKNVGAPTQYRLERLGKELDNAVHILTARLTGDVTQAAVESGKYSYEDTKAILSWDGKVTDFDDVSMSKAQIAAMVDTEKLGGYVLESWLWKALTEEKGKLKTAINAARLQGMGYKKIVDELMPDFLDAMFDGNEQNLETVAISYIQAMNAKAHKDMYEANANVIKGVEWSAILESANVHTGRGTCPRCMALDGNEYKSADKAPNIPLHPRCRCMLLPITKTWKELGILDEDIEEMEETYRKGNYRWLDYETGQKYPKSGGPWPREKMAYTEGNENYEDFWWEQNKEYQDQAVGKSKAQLIRDGKLEFSDMVNNKGELVPMDTMAKSKAKKYSKINNEVLDEVWPTRKGNTNKEE